MIRFFSSMIEGHKDIIVNLQTINFELQLANSIMINSVKQVYFQEVAKIENIKNLNDHKFEVSDIEKLSKAYSDYKSKKFSTHPLMVLSIHIIRYLKEISKNRTKYKLFFQERGEALQNFRCQKDLIKKYITDDEIFILAFLEDTASRIERKELGLFFINFFNN